MDWAGWAVFGLVATTLLTTVLVLAQLTGQTRLDLPLILGSIVVADSDRARVVGALLHLGVGQVFAAFYAAGFATLNRAGPVLGGAFGFVHAIVALGLLVPLLPGIHPRMASERAGPDSIAALEPPGVLALNYGIRTPLFTIAAHIVYGAVLGWTLHA